MAGLAVLLVAGHGRSTVPAFIATVVAAAVAGLVLGGARLDSIDRAAFTFRSGPGTGLSPGDGSGVAGSGTAGILATGFVEAEPGRSRGVIRFRLSTGRGRLMVEAPDPGVGRIPAPGEELTVQGRAGPPPDWYRPTLERHGLQVLLRADRIAFTGTRRGGVAGMADRLRIRAEKALGRSMPAREAALARGFVLGQDAGIDDRTTGDFRASGLSHLLAVSGQNVILLGLLAWPLMALAGAPPKTRRLVIALLVLLYIPLAGGGPSIQRAGVMGIAALAVATAGRAASRLWILALAAAVTLALDPRAGLDPGWQLSFAAVIGIALLAKPLRMRLEGLTGDTGWRRALAEGAAVTLAASLATAPLIGFHFGRVPVGTVAANLMVLPAIAPAMWLGMISAAVGQLWSGLAVPFNLANSIALGMIAQVAAWFGRPGWAEAGIELSFTGLTALTAALAAGAGLLLRLWRAPPPDPAGTGLAARRRRALAVIAVLAAGWLVAGPLVSGGHRRSLADPPPGGARIELFDVGQGDAILIRPPDAPAVLVDGGPPGGDLRGALRSAGVDRLSAVLLTHRHLDHYGGLFELFGTVPVGRFLFDSAPWRLIAAARAGGARLVRVGEGGRFSPGGGIRLDLLWPPPDRPAATVDPDPNSRSVGVLLTLGRFSMYLPGDGEAESVPVDPGPLDVIKVAHHGSADQGLEALLARDRPRIAVIQTGEGNPYGHPDPETMETLRDGRVRTYRTDRDGTVSIVIDRSGYRVEAGR